MDTRANGLGAGEAKAEEAAQMRALAAGDPEALRELYGRHGPALFAIAARALDPATAEEIVQDVFLALWQGARDFDPARGSVRALLATIARRRIANELRRRGRRPAFDFDASQLESAADPDSGPAALAWLSFQRAAVRDALAQLPPKQRQALGLAFFDELTHAEVAEVLHERLGTVKTRIRAALAKLREQLAPVLTTLFVVAAGLAGWAVHEHRMAGLRDRALEVVTSSDVTPLRLVPSAPGALDTHATYRARPGVPLAVLTFSHFPALPDDRAYQAWVRHGSVYTSLGTALPDDLGHARLIAEDDAFASAPDALVVTIEPVRGSAQPTTAPVVAWPAPGPR
jgi:RNA polymerase sigma factor (sigma-70 family)